MDNQENSIKVTVLLPNGNRFAHQVIEDSVTFRGKSLHELDEEELREALVQALMHIAHLEGRHSII